MVPYIIIIIIIFTKFTKEIWERGEVMRLTDWKEERNHCLLGLLLFFNATELLTLINLLVSPFIEINT